MSLFARKNRRVTGKKSQSQIDAAKRLADFTDKYLSSAVNPMSVLPPLTPYNQLRHELDLDLPTDKALGHTMYVAGVKPEQYIWCEMCCAYSGQRVQNLDKHCRGYKSRTQPIQRLNHSCNPTNNRPLATQKRRMTVRDAGLKHGWDLQGSPDATENLYANLTMSTGEVESCIDRHLFDGLGHSGSPSTSHYVITSEGENPLDHELTLW